ncbi:MAG: hypothetical protein CML68_11335 [Rhodobacteraceae bacterium]|nr:hypothetical protein [Paracoccaceae bacterium]
MLLEHTISQLDIGQVPADQAEKMGQLGFIQWLGALPGHSPYPANARRALAMARPFSATSPAIAAFCRLLTQSLDMPPRPMALQMPPRGRKGGARARRLSL